MFIGKDKIAKAALFSFAALALVSILLWGITEKNSAYGAVLKLYFGLFILMGGAFFLVKYFRGNLPHSPEKTFRIKEKLGLEPGVSLYLVRRDTQEWLIGVGNKQICLLSKDHATQENFEDILEKKIERG